MLTKGQINWTEKEEKAKAMDIAALTYSIQDCLKAAEAARGFNPENEAYYSDEAYIYRAELNKRAQEK